MEKHCNALRALVEDCMGKRMYDSAVFFADKLCSFTEWSLESVLLLGESFYLTGQYKRALLLLQQHNVLASLLLSPSIPASLISSGNGSTNAGNVEVTMRCGYLAANCAAACGNWDQCLDIASSPSLALQQQHQLNQRPLSKPQLSSSPSSLLDNNSTMKLSSCLHYIRGVALLSSGTNSSTITTTTISSPSNTTVHNGNNNNATNTSIINSNINTTTNTNNNNNNYHIMISGSSWLAAQCFMDALRVDPKCVQAFEKLIEHNLFLSYQEGVSFVESLSFSSISSEFGDADTDSAADGNNSGEEWLWLKQYYLVKLKQFNIKESVAFTHHIEKYMHGWLQQQHQQQQRNSKLSSSNSVVEIQKKDIIGPNTSNFSFERLLVSNSSGVGRAGGNRDVLACLATLYWYQANWKKAYHCTKRLIERDEYEYDPVILSIYFGSLLSLSGWSSTSPTSTSLTNADELSNPWLSPLPAPSVATSFSSSSLPSSSTSLSSFGVSSSSASSLLSTNNSGGGGSFVNELFYRAHRLVDDQPQSAIAWYAVACYYYAIQNYEAARRYFSKCTSMSRCFGGAWLGFGHTFAAQAEHDQAMAAYRTAARMLPRCHISVLCIGMELIGVSNYALAEQYLEEAKNLCPYDPAVYNEIAVLAYKNAEYEKASNLFLKVLDLCGYRQHRSQMSNNDSNNPFMNKNANHSSKNNGSSNLQVDEISEYWEPTIFNLAHCYRKMRQYSLAVKYYLLSLSLLPSGNSGSSFASSSSSSTSSSAAAIAASGSYCCLGLTYHLQGINYDIAIDYYHKALALKPEDSTAADLLERCLEQSLLSAVSASSFLPPTSTTQMSSSMFEF